MGCEVELLDAKGTWEGGFLDQVERSGTARVEVHRQIALFSAADQYFVRPRDPRMVLAYARAFGPKRVLRKIRSRQSESVRNDAWLSVGTGWATLDGRRTCVAFVVTSGPRGAERLIVERALMTPTAPESVLSGEPKHFVAASKDQVYRGLGADAAKELEALAGWQPEEGTEAGVSSQTWEAIVTASNTPAPFWSVAPPRPPGSDVLERVPGGPLSPDRPSYHVFGYGQYAKVNATANLDLRLHLAGVHEINAMQLGPVPTQPGPAWDTSPLPRDGEAITNAVVAGYHHTHVPTAVALIEQGARHVVIEKPIATTPEQVDLLLEALERFPEARVHCAFQRSYSPFNAFLRKDLGHGAISMAATVYEVPLPARHWYRWPVVGNAVVSNGCHWIDYFLHLNGYAEVKDLQALALATQTILTLELENGASATISLRHEGSPRLGVRDLIQLWCGDATATIEDNSRYESERGYRLLRRKNVHRSRATEDMYREFGRRIELDLAGDEPRAIGVSARAVVRLAALVDEARQARRQGDSDRDS